MSSRIVALNEFTGLGDPTPWVLIVGGLTRVGDQRARRAAEIALAADLSVVWFDGYEQEADSDGRRVPLGEVDSPDSIVVLYKDAERHLLLNRLDWSLSQSLKSPSLRRLRRKTVRPLVAATRSYRNWRLLRIQIGMFDSAPDHIVWCDDYGVSAAWHSARRWPGARVGMDLVPE